MEKQVTIQMSIDDIVQLVMASMTTALQTKNAEQKAKCEKLSEFFMGILNVEQPSK